MSEQRPVGRPGADRTGEPIADLPAADLQAPDLRAADLREADLRAADLHAAEPDSPAGGQWSVDQSAVGPPSVREQMRAQLLTGLGGWTGMAITAVPTLVFVVTNAVSSLRVAVVAAIGSALLLAAYRLVRRQSVQQAFNGLAGVVVAAAIAARTGQARGFFLLGIWTSFLYAGVFAASILLRRPLIGVVWEFLDPTPAEPADPPWYRRPHLARAYLLASLAATAVFAARATVQLRLFAADATGWLAVARIAMGYPLTIAALALAWWLVRRARRRLSVGAAA